MTESDAPSAPLEAAGQPASRWKRLRGRLSGWSEELSPSPEVRRGAAWGGLAGWLLLAFALGVSNRLGTGSLWLDVIGTLLMALGVTALVGLGGIAAFGLLNHSRRYIGWWGLASLFVMVYLFYYRANLPFEDSLWLGLALAAAMTLLGGAAAFALQGKWRPAPWWGKALLAAAVAAALGCNAYLIWWTLQPGSDSHLVPFRADTVGSIPSLEGVEDPSQTGPYPVLTLTYGSGKDRRPEFGQQADLITESVDASPLVRGQSGWRGDIRDAYWGFGFSELPLNARVWYPDGAGPFPLLLIVHGNHAMTEYSDKGYAYLGEHLASRGFVAAAVDQNFFNNFWTYRLQGETDARGWMLLEHLKAWQGWSQQEGNPLQGKADMENIGLIGHSRGGEAVAIAAAFNRLAYYPDNFKVKLGTHFGIRSVIAIAPGEQYEPSNRPLPLGNVNYLVMQGGHDADSFVYGGIRQYRRVRFTDGGDWFKAGLYIYRANHGQFNTDWGRVDLPWPRSLPLDLKPIMPGEEQRRIAKVYVTAFLEATLLGKKGYIPLFRDHRAAMHWLPQDYYITRYQDSTFQAVCDFEEDVDLTTASLPDARIETKGLAMWHEEELRFRLRDSKRNKVAYIGWLVDLGKPGDQASYSLSLPEGLAQRWDLGSDSLLAFSVADSDQRFRPRNPPPKEEKDASPDGGAEAGKSGSNGKEAEDEAKQPPIERDGRLDFSVELEGADGTCVRLPLHRYRLVPKPLKSRFSKFDSEWERFGASWEPTLQSVELPLADFMAQNPDFDPAGLRYVRLVFDQVETGVIILDDIGFARRSRQDSEPPAKAGL